MLFAPMNQNNHCFLFDMVTITAFAHPDEGPKNSMCLTRLALLVWTDVLLEIQEK